MSARVTFRVRKIPPHITASSLAHYLVTSVPDLGDEANIHVRSLAVTPEFYLATPDKTATVEFDKIPSRFASATESKWPIRLDGVDQSLVFDKEFDGFTPLSSVDADDYAVNCIAVHGLAGHPFGSWRQRQPSDIAEQFMWLRNQLGVDFRQMRVLIYGYKTELAPSLSFQNIDDLARNFIASLLCIGAGQYSAKPIFLLAHSLGGLLVKRAITYLARSRDVELHLLQNIRLLVFFGVPHRGMHIEHLRTIVKGQPNQDLISSLSVNSPFLAALDETFTGILSQRAIRLVSAYETVESPVAEEQPSGGLKRTGRPQVLVTRDSAVHPVCKNPSDAFHIDSDHSNMVKLSYDDSAYRILGHIFFEALADLSSSSSQNKPVEYLASSVTPCFAAKSVISSTDLLSGAGPPSALHGNQSIQEALRSLQYEESDYRYHAIETAHEATFAWIFEDERLEFRQWVRDGDGVYWIRGKPGCGKSTLFRYLHDSKQFQEMLYTHHSRAQHINIWHFFNQRGTTLQQSMEGLMRGILAQLASSSDTLSQIILTCHCSRIRGGNSQWTMQAINNTFSAVLDQDLADINVTVYIDALDEYLGFPEDIARWIRAQADHSRRPSSRTKLRFCFSSREWDSFIQAFENEPGFQLHNHTMSDIKAYTQSRVGELHMLSSNTITRDSESPNAVQELITNQVTAKASLQEKSPADPRLAQPDERSKSSRLLLLCLTLWPPRALIVWYSLDHPLRLAFELCHSQ